MTGLPRPASRPDLAALKDGLRSMVLNKADFGLPGLSGVSLHEGEDGSLALSILTKARTSPAEVKQFMEAMEPAIAGCRPDDIRFLPVGTIAPLHGRGLHGHKQRPICPGVAIARERTAEFGTMGMFFREIATGEPVFITAGHVLRSLERDVTGDPVFQPEGYRRRERIGEIIGISPLAFDGSIHRMDVAVVRPVRSFRNKLLKVNNQRKRTKSYLRIASEAAMPKKGERLVKTGAASGFSGAIQLPSIFTFAEIYYTSELRVPFEEHLEILAEQGFMDGASIAVPGDSGSVVVQRNSRKVLGMIFAGSEGDARLYYVTPIQEIMKTYGLEFL